VTINCSRFTVAGFSEEMLIASNMSNCSTLHSDDQPDAYQTIS